MLSAQVFGSVTNQSNIPKKLTQKDSLIKDIFSLFWFFLHFSFALFYTLCFVLSSYLLTIYNLCTCVRVCVCVWVCVCECVVDLTPVGSKISFTCCMCKFIFWGSGGVVAFYFTNSYAHKFCFLLSLCMESSGPSLRRSWLTAVYPASHFVPSSTTATA